MANIISWIKDKKKENIIVPKTMTKAVYNDDGTVLSDTLEEVNSKLNNNLDQYIDNEVIVGTWFGRPKYRKTYVFTDISASQSENVLLTSAPSTTASGVVSMRGMVVDSIKGNVYSDGIYVQFHLIENKLYMCQTYTTALSNASVYVILEYVK